MRHIKDIGQRIGNHVACIADRFADLIDHILVQRRYVSDKSEYCLVFSVRFVDLEPLPFEPVHQLILLIFSCIFF